MMTTTMRRSALALLAAVLVSCGGGSGSPGNDGGATPGPTPVVLTLAGASAATSGGAAVALSATHPGSSGTVAWQLGAGSPGSLSATSGDTVNYLPPPAGAVTSPTTVTVTATLDGASKSTTLTLNPAPAGVYLTAGSVAGFGNLDGTGSAARFAKFNGYGGLAVDANGNAFMSDSFGFTLRKITAQGVVTTYAGRYGVDTAADGQLADAAFSFPDAVAADRGGNLYVGDIDRIRRITAAGVVSTVATLPNGSASILGLAVAANGTMYAMVTNGIYAVSPAGVVTLLAGSTGGSSAGSFPDAPAGFGSLSGIALDASGNLIVSDALRSVVWQVTPGGVVTTLAGSVGNLGDADGDGASARFRRPAGIAIDTSGRIFVADRLSRVVRVITRPASGTAVATFAGRAQSSISLGTAAPSLDGSSTNAQFSQPYGLAINASGELLVADGSALRKVAADGTVSTLAGVLVNFRSADGSGANAVFDYSYHGGALWSDAGGTLYLAEAGSHTVRKITPAGVVTTIAGAPYAAGSADGAAGAARFSTPRGITGDASGNLYVADYGNLTIRKIAADGTVSTLAGSVGVRGTADGSGSEARFTTLEGMVSDAAGNLFVIDRQSYWIAIRKITPAGVVTTVAGVEADYAEGLAIDTAGNFYIGDYNSSVVYKITANGAVSVLAGMKYEHGTADGTGAAARFQGIGGVTTDPAGNVYVMDSIAATIRRITPAGVVTTVAGVPGRLGTVGATATLPGSLPGAWAIRYAGPNTLAVMSDSGILKVILP